MVKGKGMMIKVFVVDSRKFVEVVRVLKEHKIGYIVPKEPSITCEEIAIVITDVEEKLEKNCIKLLVRDKRDIESLTDNIFFLMEGREYYSEITIGIDVGKEKHAIIGIGDGRILVAKKGTFPIIQKEIDRLARKPWKKIKIKIGGTKGNMDEVVKLAWKIYSMTKIPVMIVDEFKSTTRKPLIEGLPKDKDIVAAYNIALQTSGFMVG